MFTLLCQLPLQNMKLNVITLVLNFILTLCNKNMSISIAEFKTKCSRLTSVYVTLFCQLPLKNMKQITYTPILTLFNKRIPTSIPELSKMLVYLYHVNFVIAKLSPSPSFNPSWGLRWLYLQLLQAGRPSRIVLSNHNTAFIPKVKLFNSISRTHKQIVTLALSAKRLFNRLLPIFDPVT